MNSCSKGHRCLSLAKTRIRCNWLIRKNHQDIRQEIWCRWALELSCLREEGAMMDGILAVSLFRNILLISWLKSLWSYWMQPTRNDCENSDSMWVKNCVRDVPKRCNNTTAKFTQVKLLWKCKYWEWPCCLMYKILLSHARRSQASFTATAWASKTISCKILLLKPSLRSCLRPRAARFTTLSELFSQLNIMM